MSDVSDLAAAEAALRARLRALAPVLVAFSGGVDSSLLLAVAHDELGPAAHAIHFRTPFMAAHEERDAAAFCRARGIPLEILVIDDLDDPDLLANPPDRCLRCRRLLFARLAAHLQRHGRDERVVLGVVADDADEYRPGLAAIAEWGHATPLADAGLDKATVRALARHLGLPVWDRPAAPCLATRLPYGEALTTDILRLVERCEDILHRAEFPACRARAHRLGTTGGTLIRIEVPAADRARAFAAHDDLSRALHAAGATKVALDLDGLVSGGLDHLVGG